MEYSFKTQGVCAQLIKFKLDGDVVSDIEFMGGCNGNLKAISKLLDGSKVDYIEDKLLGNSCGGRPTSCADQLAKAVRQAYEESK
ncbi:MAG: TIGR03905 family TSCPD domain-containing protein [Parasporobacterium sp.]|nr:TIGR03905 family TSCPD domain-containing protein [Parasporobacterium sp.]